MKYLGSDQKCATVDSNGRGYQCRKLQRYKQGARSYNNKRIAAESKLAEQASRVDEDAAIGRRWREDSSLETWFPYTAEELKTLRAKIKSQAEQ